MTLVPQPLEKTTPTSKELLAATVHKVKTSKPIVFHNGDDIGMIDLRVAICGRRNGNFRMKTDDPYDPGNDCRTNTEVIKRIVQLGGGFNVGRFVFPRPQKFNAVVTPRHIHREWPKMQSPHDDVTIVRGPCCDGAVFETGEGVCIASAGCPTVIMLDGTNKRAVAAHAGRDCLFDRQLATSGHATADRPADSVVSSCIRQLRTAAKAAGQPFVVKNLKVLIVCGISGEHFTHSLSDPQFGKTNRAIRSHLYRVWGDGSEHGGESYWPGEKLWLSRLIKRQCVVCGIPSHNIRTDSVDTHSDIDPETGEYMWADHARDSKALREAGLDPNTTPRNLVCAWIRKSQACK